MKISKTKALPTYKKRLSKIKEALSKNQTASALLLSSAPGAQRSGDTEYRYRPDSNFYYLTGLTQPDLILLFSSKEKKLLIFAKKPSAQKILWDGKPDNLENQAQALGAEVVYLNEWREVLKRLSGIEKLYYQNSKESLAWQLALELISVPAHNRRNIPASFVHADQLLEPLRLIKDQYEISLIKEAAIITNEALFGALPYIKAGLQEWQIASLIEQRFRAENCEEAFGTISATGASAAALHYRLGKRTLKNGDLLLIDCGAEHQYYAADLTRTLPVSGKFSPWQKKLYQIVLDAQTEAINTVKDGVEIRKVYNAAARVLTEGLRDLKILKGNLSKLLADKAYRPYFPHGIGHSLGLDVHDIGQLRGNNQAILKAGMVFTIEPGLYFSRKTAGIPACGVRIEDDVLVTKNGAKILSEGFPKEIKEIEELIERNAE